MPSALLQRVHASVKFIRFVYERSAGWWTLSSRERVIFPSLIGEGCLPSSKYGVRLHFGHVSVCEVGVDVYSERFFGVGRKGIV